MPKEWAMNREQWEAMNEYRYNFCMSCKHSLFIKHHGEKGLHCELIRDCLGYPKDKLDSQTQVEKEATCKNWTSWL